MRVKEECAICPYLEIFGLSISTYYLFAVLGIFVICFFVVFRKNILKLRFWELILIMALGIVFMLALSRFVYAVSVFADQPFSFEVFFDSILNGGIVFYGGMFGVLLGTVIFALITKRRIRSCLDFAAPAIPLFHSIARIGCLMSGCCYGKESTWGVPNHRFPGHLLIPVQLFESICNIIIFITIMIYQKVRKTDRYSLEIYFVGYGIARFILEFFRADEHRGIWPDGLSTSQNISILLILFVIVEAVVILVKNRNKKNKID